MRFGLGFRLAVLAVTALTFPLTLATAREVPEAELIARTTLEPAVLAGREAAVEAMTPEEQGEAMVAAVKDRTIVYYQPGHGVFAEYTSADGKVFMWYPRNKRVVYGTWGLRQFGGPKLCYQYRNATNPVTGEYEGDDCISPRQKLVGAEMLDSRPGDPFGLAAGKIPYAKTKLDLPDWPTTGGD
jgi:hypothetical protein